LSPLKIEGLWDYFLDALEDTEKAQRVLENVLHKYPSTHWDWEINQTNQPQLPYKFPDDVPEYYRPLLVSKLLTTPSDNLSQWSRIGLVFWLLNLGAPIEKVFEIVVNLDDGYSLSLTPYFEKLLKPTSEIEAEPLSKEDTKANYDIWLQQILHCKSSYVKLAFFDALFASIGDKDSAKRLGLGLIAGGVDSSVRFCIVRSLIGRDIIGKEEIPSLVSPLLSQTINHWSKSYAIDILIQLEILNKQSAAENYPKVIQEDNDIVTKWDLARKLMGFGFLDEFANVMTKEIHDHQSDTIEDRMIRTVSYNLLQEALGLGLFQPVKKNMNYMVVNALPLTTY